MKKPKKPTQPFGHINFGKDGSVEKILNKLPTTKEEQEKKAIELFVEFHNHTYPKHKISGLTQLLERDQDFVANLDGNTIEIQLTELSDTQYTFSPSNRNYQKIPSGSYVQKDVNGPLWKIDEKLRDEELRRVINKKISKGYSKPMSHKLWLVIFTTDTGFLTEYNEGGVQKGSKSLRLAREYLDSLDKVDFDEIWFTNFETRPIRIWPLLEITEE